MTGPGATLAIELSQRAGSVALRPRPGAPIDECEVPPSDDRGDHLMERIASLFDRHGLAPRDLSTIAVSVGPGGFTGLRVACATAKALADVVGCRVVAVPSSLVAAREALRSGAWRASEGARATVVTASKGSDAWRSIVRSEGEMPVEIAAGLAPAAAGVDGPLLADGHSLAAWAPVAAQGALEARWTATACLEVGERLARQEAASEDPQRLTPTYPRPPEAVSLWEARQAGAHRSG